jgi:hypothetical protein
MEENMTHFCKLSAALAAASIVVLSAQAAHAAVPMPPRPTITVPVVKPAIPSVKPHIPNIPVHHCKCIIPPHPGHPPGTINYPYGSGTKPPVKPPVTTTVTSTSSHPGSFAGQPATLNTTNSTFQGPAGSGTQTTTVITDSSGHVVGAISSAALNKPPVVTLPVGTKPAPPPMPPKPGTVPIMHGSNAAPAPAASVPQPGTVPVAHPSNTPAPAASAAPATHAPAANPAPAHSTNAAPAPAPTHNSAPAASTPPKKPDVWKPVLYPAFTDQYKSPKGYYVDGKLHMGMTGPSGTQCVSTIAFQRLGGGPVSTSGGPGMIQITAVQCYVKG